MNPQIKEMVLDKDEYFPIAKWDAIVKIDTIRYLFCMMNQGR